MHEAPTAYQKIEDVEAIVRLLAAVGDPTSKLEIPERKRMLIEGVARLVHAHVWLWVVSHNNPEVKGDAMGTSFIDGGWIDDTERAEMYRMLTAPNFSRIMQVRSTDACLQGRYTTFLRDELVPEETWNQLCDAWYQGGFDHFLLSIYPLSETRLSGIGLHRRRGSPAFTDYERAIVHTVFQQVDWLHRDGSEVPASNTVLKLSPRERQVLIFLLGGKSRKEIAHALGLSEFTVGDYIKQLHKRFGVNTRTELLAHFISGGQSM